MKTLLNNDGTISLTLEADECAAIARGLNVAISETCTESTLIWRALAGAFEGYALALDAVAELPPDAKVSGSRLYTVLWKTGEVIRQE